MGMSCYRSWHCLDSSLNEGWVHWAPVNDRPLPQPEGEAPYETEVDRIHILPVHAQLCPCSTHGIAVRAALLMWKT
jgi:hypothetical protein